MLAIVCNASFSTKILHNVYKDAAQRLQRFVLWEVSFEETFHRRFIVLALNVHGLRHKSKTISVFSKLVKPICDLN
jgi:hypothetical protein